jgi:hypothetical protein
VRAVTLDLGRVSAELLNAPISLKLTSPRLQDGQVVAFATTTTWTEEPGELAVVWAVTCEDEDGVSYVPGEVMGEDASGCDCVCDVDRQGRACGEEHCAQEGT